MQFDGFGEGVERIGSETGGGERNIEHPTSNIERRIRSAPKRMRTLPGSGEKFQPLEIPRVGTREMLFFQGLELFDRGKGEP